MIRRACRQPHPVDIPIGYHTFLYFSQLLGLVAVLGTAMGDPKTPFHGGNEIELWGNVPNRR